MYFWTEATTYANWTTQESVLPIVSDEVVKEVWGQFVGVLEVHPGAYTPREVHQSVLRPPPVQGLVRTIQPACMVTS